MKPRLVNEAEFRVIGSSVRTSNAQEMGGAGRIAKLWERFVAENLLAQIPDKLDGAILAVYTDYASDQDGEYTLIVGARVKDGAKPPQGMVAKNVPAGRYAVFTSEKGPVEKIVVGTWQRTWSTVKSELGGDRAYVADFEVYDQRAANPRDAQVDVYVGIR
jgi:predicted transcriptional regulator YdeE